MTTAWQTLGPFFSPFLLKPGENDLTRIRPGAAPAEGRTIQIMGTVREQNGVPVAGALLEIWQANAAGRYAHPADTSGLPLDPNFRGFGRVYTDREGRYCFRTIKPGPVPGPGNRWQAPHILLSIFAAGLLRRLTTRIYFPDENANAEDPVLATIEDPAARATLIARTEGSGRYVFDIVTSGEGETAFFTD